MLFFSNFIIFVQVSFEVEVIWWFQTHLVLFFVSNSNLFFWIYFSVSTSVSVLNGGTNFKQANASFFNFLIKLFHSIFLLLCDLWTGLFWHYLVNVPVGTIVGDRRHKTYCTLIYSNPWRLIARSCRYYALLKCEWSL